MKKLIALLVLAALLGGTTPVYGATIEDDFAANLSAHWTLDETTGTRYDSTANNHDLTDNNSTAYGTGIQVNAADFESDNSPDSTLTLAHHANLEPATGGDYSISVWIKPENVTGLKGVFSKEGAGGKGYTLYLNGTSLGYNHQGIGGPTYGTGLSAGTWYHVVVTYNGTSDALKMYVNNSSPVSYTAGYVDSSSATLTVASYTTTTAYPYDGLIDEFTFWKGRELSAAEVATLYNSGAGIAYPSAGGGSTPNYDGPRLMWVDF